MSVILVDWLPKLILTLWISVSSITPCLSWSKALKTATTIWITRESTSQQPSAEKNTTLCPCPMRKSSFEYIFVCVSIKCTVMSFASASNLPCRISGPPSVVTQELSFQSSRRTNNRVFGEWSFKHVCSIWCVVYSVVLVIISYWETLNPSSIMCIYRCGPQPEQASPLWRPWR